MEDGALYELQEVRKQPLGIYMHIPFCIKKCDYCDFLSMPASEEIKDNYVQAVLEEIKSYEKIADKYQVQTIYFGGGTPSVLPASHIACILNRLKDSFQIEDFAKLEVTLEVNPGTVDKEKWKAYKSMGINRISMGLQSTDNAMLKKLGRIHNYETFLESYKMARKTGFQNISIDVMSALPGQTIEQYKQTIEKIVALTPEHISSYSLIIEEGTPFWNRYGEDGEQAQELPSEEEDRKMYELTNGILKKHGYERYEISNYAKKGQESKHNSSYWTGTSYLGIGLGASSYFEGERYQNVAELEGYLTVAGNSEVRICNRERIGEKDAMEEYMFLGLRRMCGVSKQEFQQRFGKAMESVYEKKIENLQEKGLLFVEEDRVALTEYGIDVSNYVFSEFLL